MGRWRPPITAPLRQPVGCSAEDQEPEQAEVTDGAGHGDFIRQAIARDLEDLEELRLGIEALKDPLSRVATDVD